MASALDPTFREPHDFSTRSPTQDTETTRPNPLLSLPPEILAGIIDYAITDNTPHNVAANAIRWGRVATYPHLMTHEQRVENLINYAKHLDEALIILGQTVIAPLLGNGVPQLTAREIRGVMANPTNANVLDSIVRSVDLRGHGLKVIPPEINHLRNLQVLRLQNNQITQVDPQAFTSCPALYRLDLENNQLTQISPQTFASCPALQTLILRKNRISQIAPRAFAGCPALQELDLRDNQITHVGSETLAGCPNLAWLHLNNNQISQVDSQTFAGCPGLQELHLGENQITQIDPGTFAGYPALHTLGLAGNWITQIDPEAFARLGNLQTLQLNGNRLAQIDPQTFTRCPALAWLGLGDNQIAQIDPQTFTRCPVLAWLDLSNNQLAQIHPQIFTRWTAQQTLFLNDNPLLGMLNIHGAPVILTLVAASKYVCRSQWAAFYKAVSEGTVPQSEIVERLKGLEERNLIYEMVYLEAKAAAEQTGGTLDTGGGDPQWGEHHVCDDMPIFYRALKRAVREKFNRLFAEQKCAVHSNVYRIDRENLFIAPDAPAWDDPNWGENHREDNILRFIDAMEGI